VDILVVTASSLSTDSGVRETLLLEPVAASIARKLGADNHRW
jgi:hypothetical protein